MYLLPALRTMTAKGEAPLYLKLMWPAKKLEIVVPASGEKGAG